MYSREVMNALRALNRLDEERWLQKEGTAAAALIGQQQAATRVNLPDSVLSLHDRFAVRGKPSVVPLAGSSCSACHLKLPSGVLGDLRHAERYAMCPNCGVFVWSGNQPPTEIILPSPKPPKRKMHE